MSETPETILTSTGVVLLQERLKRKLEEYSEIRAQRQVAFELSGDGWHDNPEFNRAQQLEANCNHTIKRLSDMLGQASVINIIEGQRPQKEVAVGSLVTFVRWGDNGPCAEETWEIAGHGESLPEQNRVAYDAPLGAALLGLMIGEYAENVRLGASVIDLEVISLHAGHPKNEPQVA